MTTIELILETAINEAGEFGDVRLLKDDAKIILELLKVQEPKPPIIKKPDIYCPKCNSFFESFQYQYCPWCGQAVKWDD